MELMLTGNALLFLLLACAGDPPQDSGPRLLVDADTWQILDDTQDPIGPAPEPCGAAGVQVESGVIEVLTDACPWVTLGQPSLTNLKAGDTISLLAWHGTLAAPEPATGHMSIWIGEEEIWRIEPDIPSEAVIYEEQLTAHDSAPEGTMIRLHVHNHGANSWRMGHLLPE
ncbi:MAG: hypothetical protein ACI9VR_001176 [Cognaticolwellia sp.]|jgi:hypothetical protein